MKPSHWVCGPGGEINCDDWDPVNGCWQDQINVENCPKFQRLNIDAEGDD